MITSVINDRMTGWVDGWIWRLERRLGCSAVFLCLLCSFRLAKLDGHISCSFSGLYSVYRCM